VPHCAACDRFLNPNTLHADGTCPSCGNQVAEPAPAAPVPKAPWHFKLLLGATVLYLGWRLVEGIIWVAERL
jgi:rRNA maturation protein Nop10